MNKILVEFPNKRNVSFTFGKDEREKKIIVRPHMTTDDRIQLVSAYLNGLFPTEDGQLEGTSSNALFAERTFEMALVDILTNIEVMEDDCVSLDDLQSSGLLDEIKSRIVDLPALIEIRDRVSRDAMQERFSFKGIIDMITDAVKNLDMEKLVELQTEWQGLQETIKDSPLSEIMKEAL